MSQRFFVCARVFIKIFVDLWLHGAFVCVFLRLCASDRVCVRKAECVCESDSAAPSQRTHLVPTL